MCGRYELHSHPATIALAFGLAHPPDVHPRYNIAPMTDVGIVRVNAEGHREFTRVRWGLVPRWSKDTAIGNKLINARGETIADKPSFKMAFLRHRCLIPADGFYEWMPVRAGGTSRKQPLHIGMKDGSLFAFGGLFERWLSAEGEVLDTCTIVTTAANELLEPVHDRMPMIVAPSEYARWLDPANAEVADLIAPYPSSEMAFYPVSSRVNNVRNDEAALIEHSTAAEAIEAEPPPPEQESLF
jgi:putative SOS response-associated peptidase YedK